MIEEDPLQCKQGVVLKMTIEENCFIVCFREYVESLHQNSTQALLYGKVKMKVTCLFKNWKFSFFREKQCFSVQLWLASTSAWLPQPASGQNSENSSTLCWKLIHFRWAALYNSSGLPIVWWMLGTTHCQQDQENWVQEMESVGNKQSASTWQLYSTSTVIRWAPMDDYISSSIFILLCKMLH